MPTHNIIDNRNEKLLDHINRILASTEAARFAVGYFFSEARRGQKELLETETSSRTPTNGSSSSFSAASEMRFSAARKSCPLC